MSKKVDPQKLKVELGLMQSKYQSLQLLDQELNKKVQRLTLQRDQVQAKMKKLEARAAELKAFLGS